MKKLVLVVIFMSAFRLFSQQNAVHTYPSVYYQRGLELFDEKKFNAAITQFNLFMEQTDNSADKGEAEYYLAISKLYAEHSDGEAAVIRFLEKNPGSHKTHMANLALGDYYYLKRKYSSALRYYKEVDPFALSKADHDRFFFRKGYSEVQRKKYKDALETLRPLTEKENDYKVLATYYYAYCAYYTGNYSEALRAFKSIEIEGPKMVRFYVAQIYYLQGDYDKSLAYLDKYSNGVPAGLVSLIRGKNYYRKADYSKAAEYFNKSGYTRDSLNPNEIYEIAFSNYKNANYTKASEWFKFVAFQGDSLSQVASYNLADCFLKLKNKRDAMNAFAEAYRAGLNKTVAEDALFNQAKLAVDLNEANAASLLQKYVDNYPSGKNSIEAKKLLAKLMLNTNNYRDAVVVLESIGELDASTEESYQRVTLARGMELFKSRQWNEAMAMFDKCISKKSSKSLAGQAAFWKAECLIQQQSWDLAGSNYQKFLDAPETASLDYYPYAFYGMGYVNFEKNQFAEAKQYFEKFSKQSSRGKYIEKIYSDCQLRLGDCYFMLASLAKEDSEKSKYLNLAIDPYSYVSGKKASDADYAMFQTGMIYGIKRSADKKIATMKRLVADYPNSPFVPDAYFEMGSEYMGLGNNKEAERYFMYVIEDYKGNPKVSTSYVNLGRIYYNTEKDDKAIEAYTHVVDDFPGTKESAEAAETVKKIFTENGRTADYIRWKEKRGGTTADEQDNLFFNEAKLAYDKLEYKDAITKFENYLNKMRNGAHVIEANYYKAICHETLKQKEDAIRHYKVVADANGNEYQEDAVLSILELYGNDGPCNELVIYLEKIEKITKSNDTRQKAWRALFRCYDKLGKLSEASEVARRVSDDISAPDDLKAEALVYLGRAEFEKKNYKDALDRFAEAYSRYNNYYGAEAKYREAQVYFETKDYETCINSCYDQMDQFNGFDYWVGKSMILLGDAYLAKGDEFSAKATWNSVLDNFGKMPEIYNEAKEKLAKLKNKNIQNNNLNEE